VPRRNPGPPRICEPHHLSAAATWYDATGRMTRMTLFRLTQITDTHLARRLPKLTDNFDRIRNYLDATRPDLVVNSGDLGFDTPSSPDDLAFARELHDALPMPCRYLPGN